MDFIPLTIGSNAAVVHLTRGYRTLVDSAMWGHVCGMKWHALGPMPSGQVYAEATINGRQCLMHRYLTDAPAGTLVDHKRNDGLDNRLSNLRVCTVAENQANRHARKRASGIKGVHWHKAAQKWCAQMRVRGRRIYLGLFGTEAEAAAAYDAAARKHWGAFANTNS